MTFGPAILASRFTELEALTGKPSRYVIAFSGGLDSSAMLRCTVELRQQNPEYAAVPLLAIHVDHSLHADSRRWSAQCEAFAESQGVEFLALKVDVDAGAGNGPRRRPEKPAMPLCSPSSGTATG